MGFAGIAVALAHLWLRAPRPPRGHSREPGAPGGTGESTDLPRRAVSSQLALSGYSRSLPASLNAQAACSRTNSSSSSNASRSAATASSGG